MRYFAYGSNMDAGQMSARCPEAKVVGVGLLNGFELRINSDGVATIIANPRERVWGVVWEISQSDERRLEIHEGFHAGIYRKQSLTVNLTDKTVVRAFAFTAANQLPGKPRAGYLERILAAGVGHRLPKSYLVKLATFGEPEQRRTPKAKPAKVSGECLLFSYGTLKRNFPNNHLLADARFIGTARTKQRYALYCAGIPYACKEGEASQISGEIYLVSGEILGRIDALEGHPHWYCREIVELKAANGRCLSAWMYFHPNPSGRIIPSGEYLGSSD